jgi:hypothetical protein
LAVQRQTSGSGQQQYDRSSEWAMAWTSPALASDADSAAISSSAIETRDALFIRSPPLRSVAAELHLPCHLPSNRRGL